MRQNGETAIGYVFHCDTTAEGGCLPVRGNDNRCGCLIVGAVYQIDMNYDRRVRMGGESESDVNVVRSG